VIIPELQAAGAQVAAYDPDGVEMARAMLPGVEFADNVYRLSRWPRRGGHHHRMGRVQGARPGAVKELLARPILVDLRNMYPTKTMKALGFRYVCVGRGFNGEGSSGS